MEKKPTMSQQRAASANAVKRKYNAIEAAIRQLRKSVADKRFPLRAEYTRDYKISESVIRNIAQCLGIHASRVTLTTRSFNRLAVLAKREVKKQAAAYEKFNLAVEDLLKQVLTSGVTQLLAIQVTATTPEELAALRRFPRDAKIFKKLNTLGFDVKKVKEFIPAA